MKITLAAISARRGRSKTEASDRLLADYMHRTNRYIPCESQAFDSEAALFDWAENQPGRVRPHLVLLDSRGRQLSSIDFAKHIGRLRDIDTQRLILAIGPADGWSSNTADRADFLFSLGLITLPHELARVVLAEQVYRALTILAGHPYHSSH